MQDTEVPRRVTLHRISSWHQLPTIQIALTRPIHNPKTRRLSIKERFDTPRMKNGSVHVLHLTSLPAKVNLSTQRRRQRLLQKIAAETVSPLHKINFLENQNFERPIWELGQFHSILVWSSMLCGSSSTIYRFNTIIYQLHTSLSTRRFSFTFHAQRGAIGELDERVCVYQD